MRINVIIRGRLSSRHCGLLRLSGSLENEKAYLNGKCSNNEACLKADYANGLRAHIHNYGKVSPIQRNYHASARIMGNQLIWSIMC